MAAAAGGGGVIHRPHEAPTALLDAWSALLALPPAGQRYDGEGTWTAFLRHSGVNGARLFGMNGLPSGTTFAVSNTNTAPGSTNAAQLQSYGNDLNNSPVGNLNAFNAAVAALRKSDYSGRNASNPKGYAYAAPWAGYYSNLLQIDNSTSDTQAQGSPAANLAALRSLGIQPLVVHWLTCGSFAWTSLSPSDALYWGERWEVYKYQYVLATWAYTKGVARIEYWNEPDLNAACINGTTWLEHVTLRSMAIKHAYADANADVAAGTIKCPAGQSCPFNVQVAASAFASASMGAAGPASAIAANGPFGALTFANQNLVFPPQANTMNTAWANSDVYSFHSYGKNGKELAAAGKAVVAGLSATPVPVIITEHQSHTNAEWDTFPSSTDSPWEGSRFINQVISTSAAGLDAYAFKFSTTVRNAGGVTKSGIHYADVTGAPSATPGLFPVGDTTYSGEAFATVAPALAGGRALASCTPSTTSGGAFVCALTKVGNVFYLVAANDISGISDSYYAGATAAPAGDAAVMSISTAGLPVSSSSVAIVTEVSGANLLGEVSLFTSLAGAATLSKTLPPFGVMRMTLPVNAQTITNISGAAATVKAGANANTNFASTLVVGTSTTATHDTTSVGLLQFSLSGNTKPAASANAVLLELTVTGAPSAASVLHVVGLNPCAAMNWSKSSITWAGASWGLTVPSGTITAIRNNFALMSGAQPGNNFLGHITVGTGDANAVKRLDVTQFVANAAQGGATSVGFMLVRRFRTDGICVGSSCPSLGCTMGVCAGGKGNTAGAVAADTLSGGSAVTFASDTATSGAPALRIVADATATGSLSAPTISGYCSGSAGGSLSPSPSQSPTPSPTTPALANTVAITGAHTLSGYTASTFGTAQAAAFKSVLATSAGVTFSSVYITSVTNAAGSGRHLLQASVTVGYSILVPATANVTAAISSITAITTSSLVSAGLTSCTGVAVATAPSQAAATTIPTDVTTTLTNTTPSPPPPSSDAVGLRVVSGAVAVAAAAWALAL